MQSHRLKELRVTGVVLVAGLTLVALSLGKRNTSRVKQQMESLTTQQELQLASEANINESKSETQEDIDKDVSSSTENTEVTESRNDMGDTSIDDDAPNVAPPQQDAQNESSNDDTLVDPEESPKPPEAEISAGSFTASSSENDSVNLNPQQLKPLSEVTPQQENLVTNSSLLDNNMTNVCTNDQEETSAIETTENPNYSPESSQSESTTLNISRNPQLGGVLESRTVHDIAMVTRSSPATEDVDLNNAQVVSAEGDKSSPALLNRTVIESFGARLMSDVAYPFANEQLGNAYQTVAQSRSPFDLKGLGITFTSSGTPAPSNVSTALQEVPGKVLVPAVVDHVQGQALAALQALKVIEADVQPGDLCTRREYARWLVSASSALSRSSVSKVYPAMYIENVTELAFDDITAEDPDFPSIQGLAEAGLISSKLSRRYTQCSVDDDPCPVLFAPESPLSRQDLVSWKMALETKQLPVVDRKTLQQLSGFIDIQRINPDAWPALVADLAAGERGIIALSFGYTRLFLPDKPVTKAQAAIALATGEASEIVSEEPARIEAETMAEKVVAAQSEPASELLPEARANPEISVTNQNLASAEKVLFDKTPSSPEIRTAPEPLFSKRTDFTTASATTTSSPSPFGSQPIFGNPTSAFTGGNGNNYLMNSEESMAEDPVQSSMPAVPVLGQLPVSPSPGGFMFGSTVPSQTATYQFGGQQNPAASQNPSPFQASGSLQFGAGGSFSLRSGGVGGDKSGSKIVRVNRNINRKK